MDDEGAWMKLIPHGVAHKKCEEHGRANLEHLENDEGAWVKLVAHGVKHKDTT